MDLSIVIPLKDEEESLPELADWIKKVCDANGYPLSKKLWKICCIE
jgi:hypothetical protein